MKTDLSSLRPVDWPEPDSRAGRALGWVHFVLVVCAACFLRWGGAICYGLGFVAGLALVVAFLVCAVPVAALFAVGWVFRSLARRWLSC